MPWHLPYNWGKTRKILSCSCELVENKWQLWLPISRLQQLHQVNCVGLSLTKLTYIIPCLQTFQNFILWTQLHRLSIDGRIKTDMKTFNLYNKHITVVDFNIVILICSLISVLLQAETCSWALWIIMSYVWLKYSSLLFLFSNHFNNMAVVRICSLPFFQIVISNKPMAIHKIQNVARR
jgi:hypothetical protein